jgi:hypothetical protein
VTNGGAEAWVELAKATNTLGDFRLSTPTTAATWATPQYNWPAPTGTIRVLPEYDGRFAIATYDGSGRPTVYEVLAPVRSGAENTALNENYYGGRAFFGEGSAAFAMAQSLETSNGMEIAGLNAEEQSDISLTARWSHSQGSNPATNMVFFVYYDALLVLYENNVVQLIE